MPSDAFPRCSASGSRPSGHAVYPRDVARRRQQHVAHMRHAVMSRPARRVARLAPQRVAAQRTCEPRRPARGAIATWFWWLGLIIGLTTAGILFVADLFPG